MLYSHTDGLIYIVVLKVFRQWIFNCFIQVLRCLFLKTPSNANGKPIWQRKVALLGSAMLKAGVFSVMCVFFYSCGSTLSVSCFFLNRVDNLMSKYQTARHISADMRSKSLMTYLKHASWFGTSNDVRNLCGKNHGELNFVYNRCFFFLSHDSSPKTMIEQNELCNSRRADLVCPRNEQELFLIWSFYERFRGWNSGTELTNFDDWFIRLGLRKHVEGGSCFILRP